MKVRKLIIVLVVFIIIGGFLFLIISGVGKPKIASLMVESNLITSVYVDGKKVGETPYTGTYDAREVVVGVGNYETRVNLEPGIKTVIERDFTANNSSGEIISFEKSGGNETSLAVVTNPDLATVNLDNISRGVAPLKIDGLTAGTHNLSISINGYKLRNFSINLVPGYKLVTVVDLAQTSVKKIDLIPNQVFIQILDTPNGFLRVRNQPTTATDEIGQVRPGEKYQLIKTDSKTGWYDIQLTATSSGWVSNTYAVKD